MRILFVTHRFPYPTVNHAGGVYVFEIIKNLCERGIIVDLLSFINEDERQFAEQMRAYCNVIEVVPSGKKFSERIIDLPIYFFKPKFITDAFQWCFAKKLVELQKENAYDIIQFEWTQMCQYVKYIKNGAVKILTEHDVSIIPVERDFLRLTKGLKKLKKWWTLKLLRKYEPRQCVKFDMVFTLSKKDADYLTAINPQIKTFAYPIFIKTIDKIPDPPANKDILFLAHLGRIPNVEAIEWFYNDVFIEVCKIHAEAILTIVGAEPHERVLQIAKNKNVRLFANVERLEDFYTSARVFVSPLLTGGGVIKKNLDAMALGCPLITTTVGNEGINGVDGRDVFIVDSKEKFIERLDGVLANNDIWKNLSANGRLFIETHYNFNSSLSKVVEKYNLLINT